MQSNLFIDVLLVLVVFRQMREARLGKEFLILPVLIVAWVLTHYLVHYPINTTTVVITVVCSAIGLVTGIAGGLLTRVRVADGHAYVKAGAAAATIWIVSMGARLAFIYWATHAGSDTLARFSAHHDIPNGNVYQSSLVILAMSEVAIRFGIIFYRGYRAKAEAPSYRVTTLR